MCFKRILIAVEARPLAEEVAKQGFKLAKALEAEVAVIHVISLTSTMNYVDSGLVAQESKQYLEEASDKLIDGLIEEFGQGSTVEKYIPEGVPSEEIINKANDWKADLLVMGTHGRSGLAKFFIGSTEEDVVSESNCSVLVIHDKEEPS